MNLQDMKGAVILLGLIALIGSAVAIALSDFRDNVEVSSSEKISVINETVEWVNNTFVGVTYNGISYFGCTNVLNSSDGAGAVISTDLYTCTQGLGIKVTTSNETTDAVTGFINVSYQYSDGNTAYNSSAGGLEGIANTTGYLDTIGTIIGVAVLIGIVVLAFTFARR